MKITIARDTGMMTVDGKALKIDTSSMPKIIETIEWDTIANEGMIQFQENVFVNVRERDLEREAKRNATLREANKPESDVVIYRERQVHRPPQKITEFPDINLWLERFEAAKVPPPPPPLTPEEEADLKRKSTIDNSIKEATYGTAQPATLEQLKSMNLVQYNQWFNANFNSAGALIALLKHLTLIIIRRVL